MSLWSWPPHRSGSPYPLVLSDVHMPLVDGFEFVQAVRENADFQRTKIVMLSSGGYPGDVSRCKSLGVAAYLTKPARSSALFDTLMDLFSGDDGRASKAAPEKRPETLMAQYHPLRILLAEDNAVNQKLALRLLEKMGYRADVAGNGLEAIEAVERQSYDVILMDVQMPEMDGLEATRQIVARWSVEERPTIVAMTANAMQGDRELTIEAGMDDYVAKPIRVDELVGALSRVTPLREKGDT